MASTDKSTPVPYQPASPPLSDRAQDLSRATWEELYRIATRMVSIDQPAALAIKSNKVCPIQTAVVWTRLLNTGIIFDWENPLGQFDGTTGIWTCSQEGLYIITFIIEIPAFPSPGGRIYEATLRTTRHPADGSPDTTLLSKTGGPDEASLRLVGSGLFPLYRGDQLWWDLDLTQEATTGNVDTFSIMYACRQASIR